MTGEELFDRFVGAGVTAYEVVANYEYDVRRLAADIGDIRFYEPDDLEMTNLEMADKLLSFCWNLVLERERGETK